MAVHAPYHSILCQDWSLPPNQIFWWSLLHKICWLWPSMTHDFVDIFPNSTPFPMLRVQLQSLSVDIDLFWFWLRSWHMTHMTRLRAVCIVADQKFEWNNTTYAINGYHLIWPVGTNEGSIGFSAAGMLLFSFIFSSQNELRVWIMWQKVGINSKLRNRIFVVF